MSSLARYYWLRWEYATVRAELCYEGSRACREIGNLKWAALYQQEAAEHSRLARHLRDNYLMQENRP